MSVGIEISECGALPQEESQEETRDEDNLDEMGPSHHALFVDNGQLLRKAMGSDDEFDFDSAFSSESNNMFTDDYMDGNGQEDGTVACGGETGETERFRSLEDEHEALSSNLIALTSHFAQVQLRLRQIVEAPVEERDHLLKSLEEFAFLGIPELQEHSVKKNIPEIVGELDRSPESMENLRERQHALIEQLKNQLTDLERYAYESGSGILPHTVLLERQKVVIDEIKNKINLNLHELDLPQLTTEDLRIQVDSALDEKLVNPLKMKEKLVSQLKTQIQDLERFISFLQTNEKEEIKKRFLQQQELARAEAEGRAEAQERAKLRSFNCGSERNRETFQRNMMKRSKENCWGDVRAKLEIDVQEVVSLAMDMQKDLQLSETASECGGETRGNKKNYELTMIVRKHLAKTIQGLMQHGLRGISESSGSLVPFISGCFSGGNYQHAPRASEERFYGGGSSHEMRRKSTGGLAKAATTTAPKRQSSSVDDGDEEPPEMNLFSQLGEDDDEDEEGGELSYGGGEDAEMHAWELLLIYYNIKNGDRYNSTPARKLSESFNLDLVEGRPQSNKQYQRGRNNNDGTNLSLLSTIGTIVALHSPYKRSYNSQFKAFICAALNAQKLTQWLHLLYQCKELVGSYYASWSYVANTGFRDALKSLDRLTQYRFDLPVDLSIRQFKNIKDVFM
ncbi:RUN domain-containing protein 1 [Culex quinquefasciatus]|uniref:RUN domain-containing protein 1 n=1 Tax=Culex quinquefasciatus TaxID=7176 RepID=B0WQF0_CULQU|nr:RUN domain-containing protein 1 [Culex quinquefasciatus]|eukprot:XP_001850934.1 RUN domain-containing protein 1 [Culex quinquefasciatus]